MTKPAFSIIVPTYKEANNLVALLQAISDTNFGGRAYELLFIDDHSQDGSLEIMQNIKSQYPWARMLTRLGERGLSRAVVYGCAHAAHQHIVCMDADLSHPVTSIPDMLAALESKSYDMVIGSRYISGGSVDPRWSWLRRAISSSCAFMTRKLLGLKVKDPLSGFFAIEKQTFLRGNITKPSGWKIALEILIKSRCQKITEVPIHFSDRRYGKSKLTTRVGIAFIKQLSELAYIQYTR